MNKSQLPFVGMMAAISVMATGPMFGSAFAQQYGGFYVPGRQPFPTLGRQNPSVDNDQTTTYPPPSWGSPQAPNWGHYNHALGQSGWQVDESIRPPVAGGTILNPSQANSPFDNPRTGATLFLPKDT